MINNLIESVWNSEGRFRTLQNLIPATECGDLKIHSGAGYCDFEMQQKGRVLRMRCWFENNKQQRDRLNGVSSFLKAIDEPFYSHFGYYEEEMLVFDDHGGYRYIDVSVEGIPDGIPLAEAIHASLESGGATVVSYIDELVSFALRHRGSNFLHGGVSAANISVDNTGRMTLTGLDRARRGNPAADIVNLTLLTCVAALSCSDIRALELLSDSHHEGKLIFGEILRAVPELPGGSGLPHELKRALSLAIKYDLQAGSAQDVEDLLQALISLKGIKIEPDDSFSAMLDSVVVSRVTKQENPRGKERKRYEFIGEPYDMLMRAFDGKTWCYLDKNARIAIPGPFTEAYDFYEGHAVVEKTEECWGLIDRQGNYVLDPVYSNMEMEHESNRLILTRDGLSGLATRLGVPITPMQYDHIISSREGIFMVRSRDLYGFITRDGIAITDTVFEDAENFNNGRAIVKLKGRWYVIGTDGIIIDEIIQKKQPVAG